ncbi:MAG: thymidine phosphorylase [Dehalococcoidia bacterium]|nr:thymidine phosphorylase [Dehalococcoidia bacterium]
MRAVDLIARKRDNQALTEEEIRFFVHGYTSGDIPDSQMAALLMAIVWRGMEDPELQALTDAMVSSGVRLDLEGLGIVAVDKHSTGGVGDKTTLVLLPMLAAIGVPVAKMSGRGLGFTGGTLDKLESFTNFKVALSKEEFIANLRRHGIVVAAQTADLVPADGKMYALRDITATVDSIPLIASSIMSKKIAGGAHAIMLDVKSGRGAFMQNQAQAGALANTMIGIGRKAGKKMVAVISDMSQPLGSAVGNALEVKEAIQTLRGEGPADLLELCLTLGANLAVASGIKKDIDKTRSELRASIQSGMALSKLAELVASQGGKEEEVYDPSRLPAAPVVRSITATRSAVLVGIDARVIGGMAGRLGGGRNRKGEAIDHAVGLLIKARVGAQILPGSELVEVHARRIEDALAVEQELLAAFELGDEAIQSPPLIHLILG